MYWQFNLYLIPLLIAAVISTTLMLYDWRRRETSHWAIQVADTGIGIPHEAQAPLFEPFTQVDGSITREPAGTGLGLSIVKQLATLMGGEVTLKTEVGRDCLVALPTCPGGN